MVIQFVQNHLLRPIAVTLAIYMINISVDVADYSGQFDPNVNEIESFVELVFEVIMDKGNVIIEEDEPDPESNTCLTCFHFFIQASVLEFRVYPLSTLEPPVGFISPAYTIPTLSINDHPPQG